MRISLICVCVAGWALFAWAQENAAQPDAAAADRSSAVAFDRESGDEYFYVLRNAASSGCLVAQGDLLIFTGQGIVKGLVAPFRGAAKKECGAWRVSKQSAPGRVMFEASSDAAPGKECDGFTLTARMGSARNDDGKLGLIDYRIAGKGCASQGRLPGPALAKSPAAAAAAYGNK